MNKQLNTYILVLKNDESFLFRDGGFEPYYMYNILDFIVRILLNEQAQYSSGWNTAPKGIRNYRQCPNFTIT